MAHSRKTITANKPVARVFDFISNFTHARFWDPRTIVAQKLSPGPIGVGTRFMLTGRVMGLSLDLPYEIVEYQRPHTLRIAGQTWFMHYHDSIAFAAADDAADDTTDACRITWDKAVRLSAVLYAGNPALALLYRRVLEESTGGVLDALERYT